MSASGDQVPKSKGKKNKLSLRTSAERPLLTHLLTAPSMNYNNGANTSTADNGQTNYTLNAAGTFPTGQENVEPMNISSSNQTRRQECRPRKISFQKVRLNNFFLVIIQLSRMGYYF